MIFALVIGNFWHDNVDSKENSKERIFANEKAIQFTIGKQTVDAFKGTIEVLENRNNPNSRKIPLTYVRFPATGKVKGSPIVYLSGGPGGSGISTAKIPNFRFPLFMAMREFGDVIALDQRGTGESKVAPKCHSKQALPLDKKLSEKQIAQTYQKAAKECVQFWQSNKFDVLGYTSLQSAHDLNDLRKHLKADKLTLWGISYGSHLAFASMKVMSNHIDKVIIASAEGLNQTVKLPAQTDAYFARLQQAINQQPKAKQSYSDLKGLIQRVHKQLDKKPIQLNLAQENGEPIKFLFQRFHMQAIASGMIADPHRGVPRLLSMYSALDNGITNFLPSIIKRAGFDKAIISFDIMPFGMDIASGITKARLTKVNKQAQSSLLGSILNFPMPHLNNVIKGLDLGDEFRQYPQSNIPTLLLSGTLDGRTYVESQKEATKGLTNLTHLVVKNAGHNLFMLSPKVTEAMQLFMRGEKIKDKTIVFELPAFVK